MDFSSYMLDFGICERFKEDILESLHYGIDIPAQLLLFDAFPDAAGQTEIQTSVRVTLSNVTNLLVVFPRHSNDMVVMQNPMYQNLQLMITIRTSPIERYQYLV